MASPQTGRDISESDIVQLAGVCEQHPIWVLGLAA